MLDSYLKQTRRLLQNPTAPAPLYSDPDLIDHINSARGQLAGESKAIRFEASLPLVAGQRVYPFTSVVLTPAAAAAGILGILDIEFIWYLVGDGRKALRPRPWPWFAQYELNNPVPDTGPPAVWTQYGQGATAQGTPNTHGGGSLYVSPLPDTSYDCPVDCVCFPIPLTDDNSVEAIPYLWTDAVAYFAAYLALLSAQTGARVQDAQRMLQLYTEFVQRARRGSTPMILPGVYPQQENPTRPNQLGVQAGAGR